MLSWKYLKYYAKLKMGAKSISKVSMIFQGFNFAENFLISQSGKFKRNFNLWQNF